MTPPLTLWLDFTRPYAYAIATVAGRSPVSGRLRLFLETTID
jgi:hypothetical protein